MSSAPDVADVPTYVDLLYIAACCPVVYLVLRLVPRLVWLLSFPRCDYPTSRLSLRSDSFEDTTSWVTGASSGIGRALAHLISSRGGRVILSSRPGPRLDAVARELSCPPDSVVVLPVDLCATSQEDLREVAATAVTAFGDDPHLDYLFNNAGATTRAMAEHFHDDNLRDQVALNFIAPATLTLACMPALRAARGAVVNTSSIASMICTPVRAPYCAVKAAVSRWHECLRLEQCAMHVPVDIVNVCPGGVKTDVARNAYVSGKGERRVDTDPDIEAGLPVEYAADRIAAAALARHDEVWLVTGKQALATYMVYYVPWLWRAVGDMFVVRAFKKSDVFPGKDKHS